jgi:hypothetical protein
MRIVSTIIIPPLGVNLIAFDKKLRRICKYLFLSPRIYIKYPILFSSYLWIKKMSFYRAWKSKLSNPWLIVSNKLKNDELRLNLEFSIFAKSNKSLIKFINIVDEKSEFFNNYSSSNLRSSLRTIPSSLY